MRDYPIEHYTERETTTRRSPFVADLVELAERARDLEEEVSRLRMRRSFVEGADAYVLGVSRAALGVDHSANPVRAGYLWAEEHAIEHGWPVEELAEHVGDAAHEWTQDQT